MSGAFKRTTRVGATRDGAVFVTVEWDGRRLSITGVEGPKRNGDATGGCGQIIDTLEQLVTHGEGWDAPKIERLREVWERWHLNDMRPGCEHQRAEGWADRPIYPDQPTSAYVKHPDGQSGWNMLTWLPVEKGGLLSAPCPTCGYKYGTRWLFESVPVDVVEWLEALPDSGTDDWGRVA